MLEKKYNSKKSEKQWQDFWKDNGVYKFNLNSDKPVYSVDTPPPTVNGKIHIGHIFSYSQAEIMARYKRMQGNNVFYPFGFDDNGLPTERLVEKNNGIKAHETSRENFTKLCLKETEQLEKQFRDLFISVGFSCDWDYEYSTISKKAQITSQKSFIDLYKKGKVYFSKSPALWCTECQTAIAQAELETKELPSTFNYLRFYFEDSDEFIEIATTRPELLAACQCIFINPLDAKSIHLVGKKVRIPLFNFVVPILANDKVSMEKGSGVVMCCTFGDLTDLEWYKKYKLDFKEAILSDGTMSALCGKYQGLKVEDARKSIINDLIAEGYMIKQDSITHNVSTHERCGKPMEITIKNQWFIDILSNKNKYIEAGNQINWYPEHMKSRYINWVENLEWDWCISRQRYFGVPFPVWYCKDCGKTVIADINDLPVNPLTSMPKEVCECGCNQYIPEKDIMDTWATSSVTPLINLDWYDNSKFMSKLLPMSVRPNAHDIIRTWDFYTIVKSLYHTDKLPWKNVMISGHVMANKSEKISKRKNNSKMDPQTVIQTYSADAVRYWASTGSLGNDIVFSEQEFKTGNKLINKIWNASKFVIMHLEGFDKKDDNGNDVKLNPYNKNDSVVILPMDRWIISNYNEVYRRYCNYLNKYEIGLALGEIEKFFWNFCDNYIEIVKNRLYKPEIYGEEARKSGLFACYQVLFGILKSFAIYFPHITEEIYQNYFKQFEKEISIHLCNMSNITNQFLKDKDDYLRNGDTVVEIISYVRRYKSENNLSLKTQINEVVVNVENVDDIKLAENDILSTCSINNITFIEDKELNVIIQSVNDIV
jgi:valyl-tRNA synthetase